MNQNQFEQIARKMDQRFGNIRKGDEDAHMIVLVILELSAYQTYLEHHSLTGSDMQDAICLVLYHIQNKLTGTQVDTAKFENKKNLLLKKALLSAFDPDEDTDAAALWREAQQNIQDFTEEKYYGMFVQGLLRILDSVKTWTKERGSGGYFGFLDEQYHKLRERHPMGAPSLTLEELQQEFPKD